MVIALNVQNIYSNREHNIQRHALKREAIFTLIYWYIHAIVH